MLAKLATMTAILFAFSFIPQVILFVGQMLVSNDGALRYARDNAEVIWQVPVAVALLAMFYAAIGVAVSSLTSRRIIAGASIIGLFLDHLDRLVDPRRAVRRGGPNRERPCHHRPSRRPPGRSSRSCQDPRPPTTYYGSSERKPSAAPLLNLAGLPLILRDVVFLGEVDPDHPMSGVEDGGLLAGGRVRCSSSWSAS